MAKSRLRFSKKIMTPGLKKRIVLLAVIFLLSFFISVFLFNIRSDTIFSVSEYEPTLPTISIESQGEELTLLYGYREEMEYGRINNAIIPLDSERTLSLVIDTHGQDLEGIYYEVSYGGGDQKLSGEEITDYNKSGDIITATLRLTTLVDPFKDYDLNISLNMEGENVNYYSSILYTKGTGEFDCLEFARNFCRTALSEDYDKLAIYMEPDGNINDTSLASVSIKSSLNDVGWAGFGPKHAEEPRAEFVEITPEYTALNLYYGITRPTDTGEERYEVKEYYRMRKGTERIYLLDFQRELAQVLNNTAVALKGADLFLGMNAGDISFKKNQTGTNIAFSWEGILYSYDSITSTLSRIFSFGESGGEEDIRITHNEHDIYIRQIDENGNVDFVVYGYMNSGPHEGYSGVGLYHYEHTENITTEQGFIALNYPFEAIKGSFDGQMHLIDRDRLYLAIEDELICANLTEETVSTVCKAEEGSSFAISAQGLYMAYAPATAEYVEVTDLTTQRGFSIEAPPDKKVRVVGFMGEDLLYGIMSPQDYNDVNIADEIFPCESVVITDPSAGPGAETHEYGFAPNLITGAKKQSDVLYLLEISARTSTGYTPVGRDSIQNTASLDDNQVELVTKKDGRMLYQVVRLNDSAEKNTSIIFQNFDRGSNISYYETTRPIYVTIDHPQRYYAYKGRTCLGSFGTLARSIQIASGEMGYCLDKDGRYIWQYGHGAQAKEISHEEVATRPVSSEYTRYNLHGVPLTMVLSYVYQGNPVYINENLGDVSVITQFGENYITIYHIPDGKRVQMLISEATNQFDAQGCWYSTYLLN